jgi:hypothetical protein
MDLFAVVMPGILTLFCIGGFYIAYLYGRHTKQFRWREYMVLIAAPLICVGYLIYLDGVKVLELFLISGVVGLMMEYGMGRSYHKTLNRRLWTYNRYSLGGYTSWLVLPLWGIAGVIFWLLSTKIGL